MILTDLSQTIISVAFQQLKGDYNKDLIRSMVFQTLVSYKKKFGAKYGSIVLAIDSRGEKSWRKKKYAWYKANRKKKFDDPKEKERWDNIFEAANQIIEECKEFLTWKTVGVQGAEADDVIAVLSKQFGSFEPTLIISTDGDFGQLQKYPMVDQYAAIQKKFIKLKNPMEALHQKILTGDRGDGIPNILSPSTAFVDGIRQKPVTEKISSEWMANPVLMESKYKDRISENRELIDFDHIPSEIQQQILQAYQTAPVNGIQGLYRFFIAVKMSRILTDIELFKVKSETYAEPSRLHSDADFFDGGTF